MLNIYTAESRLKKRQ